MFKAALLAAFIAANGGDLVSTHNAMSRGCVEGNPVMGGAKASFSRVVITKVAISIPLSVRGYKSKSKYSKIVLIAGATAGAFATVHNMMIVCH